MAVQYSSHSPQAALTVAGAMSAAKAKEAFAIVLITFISAVIKMIIPGNSLFHNGFGDSVAFAANVETGFGLFNATALKVEVLGFGLAVGDNSLNA